MSYWYGRRKTRPETTETLPEPPRKKRKFLYGKQRKLQLQQDLSASQAPNTFANSFRQERINQQLAMSDNENEDNNNNKKNTNQKHEQDADKDGDIQIISPSKATIARKKIVGKEENKRAKILGKYGVTTTMELRNKAAKSGLEVDKAYDKLSKKNKDKLTELVKKLGSIEEACRVAAGDKKLADNLKVYLLRKSAETSAVEAISTCDELEAVIELKKQMAHKEEHERAEKVVAEEELRQVCLADNIDVFMQRFIYIYIHIYSCFLATPKYLTKRLR